MLLRWQLKRPTYDIRNSFLLGIAYIHTAKHIFSKNVFINIINLFSPLDFFWQLSLNHGLIGKMKKITSQPKVETATLGATSKGAPITYKPGAL